jgi:hypothetical protein
MYGYFYPLIMYGVWEDDHSLMISPKWLKKFNPNLETYAAEVIRGFMANPCYGITCTLNNTTGQCQISAEHCEIVNELYDTLKTLYPDGKYKVGYFVVLAGDYQTDGCFTTYVPGCDDSDDMEPCSDADDMEPCSDADDMEAADDMEEANCV